MVLEHLERLARRLSAVPDGNFQVAGLRLDGSVNHKNVAVADADPQHGPTVCAVQEGCRRTKRRCRSTASSMKSSAGGGEAQAGACAGQGNEMRWPVNGGGAD